MMNNSIKIRIETYLESSLTKKRKQHTYSVVREACSLALHYGEDPKKAELAALFHDAYRDKPKEILDSYIKAWNIDSTYLGDVNLSHGKVAALAMEREYGVKDKDLINAVAFHTTGRPNMSLLEKIIYLADAIEPNRCYPGVRELRKLAYRDIDKACVLALENSIKYIQSQKLSPASDTVKAKQLLLAEERSKHEQP